MVRKKKIDKKIDISNSNKDVNNNNNNNNNKNSSSSRTVKNKAAGKNGEFLSVLLHRQKAKDWERSVGWSWYKNYSKLKSFYVRFPKATFTRFASFERSSF